MTVNSSSRHLDNATLLSLSFVKDEQTGIITSVFYTLVAVINLVGNILSLWILIRHTRPKKASIIFMIHLTLTDLALGAALPFQIAYQLQGYHWTFGSNMCSIHSLVFYTNMYCSILTMMAIGIDRYLGIVKPMLYKQIEEVKKKFITVACCLAMWVLVLIVLHPLMTTDLTFDIPEFGITTCFDVLKRDMLPSKLAWAAFLLGMVLILFLLPFCVTMFCYINVIRELGRNQHTVQKERAIRVIVIVLLVFTLCFAPSNLLLFAHAVLKLFYGKSLYKEYKLALGMSCLNSCLDPFIYYFASKEFRQKLRQIMRLQNLSGSDSMRMECRESGYSTQAQDRENTNACLVTSTAE